MNVELLELLELDDLQGEARELAECIGMEAFRRLLGQKTISLYARHTLNCQSKRGKNKKRITDCVES